MSQDEGRYEKLGSATEEAAERQAAFYANKIDDEIYEDMKAKIVTDPAPTGSREALFRCVKEECEHEEWLPESDIGKANYHRFDTHAEEGEWLIENEHEIRHEFPKVLRKVQR